VPRYRTLLIAPAEDAEALPRGADSLGDQRVTSVAEEEEPRPSSGEFVGTRTVVSMELDGPTTQSVVNEARAIYERIREHAGLPPGSGHEPVAMSPMNRLLMFDPRSGDFFQIAEGLYDQGNYLYTVVAAQTAFELYMEGVFEYVLHLRSTVAIGAAIGDMIRSYNLDDRRVRDLWEGFTGHKVTAEEKTWEAYKAHLERRHGLVHRGERVAKEEAAASLTAVNELAVQIAAVVMKLMPQFREESAPSA
jgi:hypothetical protein